MNIKCHNFFKRAAKQLSYLSVAVLAVSFTSSAQSADLGGDCCADLEERVATLEATTARKGNRKTSLTITGWVAEQIVYWDDGIDSDVYVTDLGAALNTNFKLLGSSKINSDLSAGYMIHIEVSSADSLVTLSQDDDDGSPNFGNVGLIQSYGYIESKTFGKVSLGLQSASTDNLAVFADTSGLGSLAADNWVLFQGLGYFLNSGGQRVTQGGNNVNYTSITHCHGLGIGVAADCSGVWTNSVLYTSPTMGGFTFLAAWGEDDFWDVAVKYAGTFGDFRFNTSVGYSSIQDQTFFVNLFGEGKKDIGYLQAGATLMHTPTGLFVYGAFGKEFVEDAGLTAALGAAQNTAYENAVDDNNHWMVKVGIRRKFNELGATVLSASYSEYNDMLSPQAFSSFGWTGSQVTRWGLQMVQEIDSAGLQLFLNYHQIDGDIDTGSGNIDLDELHFFKAGGIILF